MKGLINDKTDADFNYFHNHFIVQDLSEWSLITPHDHDCREDGSFFYNAHFNNRDFSAHILMMLVLVCAGAWL